jgi:hypothetical protein
MAAGVIPERVPSEWARIELLWGLWLAPLRDASSSSATTSGQRWLRAEIVAAQGAGDGQFEFNLFDLEPFYAENRITISRRLRWVTRMLSCRSANSWRRSRTYRLDRGCRVVHDA